MFQWPAAQFGLSGLIISAIAFLAWRIHRNYSTIDPELARVRAMTKIAGRAAPWWRFWKRPTIDEATQLMRCMNPHRPSDPAAPEAGRGEPPDRQDSEAEAGDSAPPDDSNGP